MERRRERLFVEAVVLDSEDQAQAFDWLPVLGDPGDLLGPWRESEPKGSEASGNRLLKGSTSWRHFRLGPM
jgi:hypothetical protein